MNVFQKLVADHLAEGEPRPGTPIGLRIDQTLTQDATGTLVMLELEAMGLERVRTQVSAQYVDHNLMQADTRNADDHLFLESACRRWGLYFSPPGNGVSHVVHMQQLGRPGSTLLGSDSHTCAAGSLGMLAIGAGGLDVAMAMTGEPYRLPMPSVWGIELTGRLPDWVSAKDVILELLRRYGVRGGVSRVLEYTGPGVMQLSAMDRHVIANMGAELGATASVFPSDERTREYLDLEGRPDAWRPLRADRDADYEIEDTIDLSALVPLVAKPASPGNVVPVEEVAGEPIYQAYIGSSANPGYRDFAVAAEIVRGRRVDPSVSFDVNPTSRRDLQRLTRDGHLGQLLAAGGRLHQAGCNGCIGMGQAPATGRNSLRTTPRNFPGRSGAREDSIFLCSPETAAASALHGRITDPRELGMACPHTDPPASVTPGTRDLIPPPPPATSAAVELVKGPDIASLPALAPIPDTLDLPVLLVTGDDISTDTILPAGARVLPWRSNIPKISEFAFADLDPDYARRAGTQGERGGHAIVAGENYGQGSSREHAALAVRYLGLRMVLAKSYARIHLQNLINFGVLPLRFADKADGDSIAFGARLQALDLHAALRDGMQVLTLQQDRDDRPVRALIELSPRDREVLLAGGLTAWARARLH